MLNFFAVVGRFCELKPHVSENIQHRTLTLPILRTSVADPDPNPYPIHRIHMFLGLLDPDPDSLVRGMDLDPDPDPSIIKQK
jgi:hypothetical protein